MSVPRFFEGRVPQMAGRKAKAYEPRNTLNTRKGDYGIVEMGVSRGFLRKFILRVECFQEFLVKMLCLINIG